VVASDLFGTFDDLVAVVGVVLFAVVGTAELVVSEVGSNVIESIFRNFVLHLVFV